MTIETEKKPNRWRSWLVQILIFGAIIAAVGFWQTRDAASGAVPNLKGRFLDGQAFEISSYRGAPLLVHFWATWCPICKLEKGTIQSVSEDHAIVTIASWSDGPEAIQAYMQEYDLDFPVMADDDGVWANLFGIRGVPATFVIGPRGNIRFVEIGYTTEIGIRLRLWWAGIAYG